MCCLKGRCFGEYNVNNHMYSTPWLMYLTLDKNSFFLNEICYPTQEAVDTFGLSALDRLFCFMIVRELQNYIKYLQRSMMMTPAYQETLKKFTRTVSHPEKLVRKWSYIRLEKNAILLVVLDGCPHHYITL